MREESKIKISNERSIIIKTFFALTSISFTEKIIQRTNARIYDKLRV
jgi:hypothetical protein